MRNTYYNNTNNTFPRQRIPNRERTPEWKEQSVRGVNGMAASSVDYSQRSSRENKQINYDMYNGISDPADMEYVTDPLGVNAKFGGTPSRIEAVNLTKTKIDVLKGEEGSRPFSWMARGVGGNVITIKTEKQRELLLQLLQGDILNNMGLNPSTQGDIANLPQVKKYMETEFMDSREVTANQVLNYLVRREHIARKFNEGWEHALIVAEEIYHVGIKNGHPHLRVVNPLSFDYDKDIDEKFIEYGEWARERRWLHPSTILDLYDEELTNTQKEDIENGNVGGMFNQGMQVGFAYQDDVSPDDISVYNEGGRGSILVTHVSWRSWEQVTFLKDLDLETGKRLTSLVEEGYVLSKEQKARKAKLTHTYKPQIWIGTQIGNDIFVDVRPADVQNGKLPYIGFIYNSTNSKATSLMDIMKPHQHMHTIVYWKMMDEVAKSKGKKVEVDLAMLPKSWGIDLDSFLYYFNNADISFVNSLEENPITKQKATRNSAFKEIDMSMSQSVSQFVVILQGIKADIEEITGVTRQREGRVMTSETATGTQQAIAGSSYITEPYFRNHNYVKRNVLEYILDTAKVAYKDGKEIQFVVDEAYTQLIKIDGDEFTDSDYGLFVSDSSKDYMNMQKVERLMEMAIQQKQADLMDAVKLYQANSLSEYEGILAAAMKRKSEEAQAMDKQRMEMEDRQHQETMAWEKEKQDREDARNTENNKTKLKIADKQIANQDVDKDGIPDVLEKGKVATAQMKVMSDMSTKNRDLDIKSKKNNEDTSIKKEANQIKKKEIVEDNKLAREEMSHEKTMVAKEEKLKLTEDSLKDKDFNRQIKLDNHKVNHEVKMGSAKVSTAEKQLKVKSKDAEIKAKVDNQKLKTAAAMKKLKPKTTSTSKK